MCSSCSGVSRKCDCEKPLAINQKTNKGRRVAEREQPQVATAAGSPEAELNYKSICWQLQQKNQQLGKAFKGLNAQFDELKENFKEREEQLAEVQQDTDKMSDLVRQNEQRIDVYKEQLTAKHDRIKALEQQLWTLQNSSEPSGVTNHEAAVKVGRNDLAEIQQQ